MPQQRSASLAESGPRRVQFIQRSQDLSQDLFFAWLPMI
jgi:hypothetical protein